MSKGRELLRQAAITQLDRLYRAKVMRHTHDVVMRFIGEVRWYEDERAVVETAASIIRGKLNAEVARAATDAMLTGDLAHDSKIKAEAVHLAHGWLLGASAGVMQLLSPTGQVPGRYLSDVHDQLKGMLQSELRELVRQETVPLPQDVPTLQALVRARDTQIEEMRNTIYTLRYPQSPEDGNT